MITWEKALAVNLTYYYLDGLSVPIVVRLGMRFPLLEARWGRALLVHVMASIVLTGIVLVATESFLK